MIIEAIRKLILILFTILILATGCKKHGFTNSVTHEDITTGLRSATTTGSQQIKIATYNAHLYLGIALKDDDARLQGIENYLHSDKNDNDVVFFQETWTDVAKNKLANELRDVYPFSYHTNSVSLTGGDGLFILSKLPIIDNTFYKFSDAAGWDFFAPKGFLKTLFSTPDGDFIVFSTHTNSDAKYDYIREKQFKQIKTETEGLGGIPSIIAGDLNVIGDGDEYETMFSILENYKDTFREVFPDADLDKGYTFDNDKNKLTDYFYPNTGTSYEERLDYILISVDGWKTLNAKVKTDIKYDSSTLGNDIDCSDHYLYQATLVLTHSHQGENTFIANTYDEAVQKIDALKSKYGIGLTARTIIHNNTIKDINFNNKAAWYNSTFYNVIPAVIPAGKFGIVLAAHDTGEATGVFNQISYTIGMQRISFGTYVPWSWAYTNNVLVDFEEISQNTLEKYSTRPSMSKVYNGIRLEAAISTGDSPLINFKVSEVEVKNVKL